MTKQSVSNPIKHTITVTKVVHVANSALRGSSAPSSTSIHTSMTTVPSNREQVCFYSPICRKGLLMEIIPIFCLLDSAERPSEDRKCEEHRPKG